MIKMLQVPMMLLLIFSLIGCGKTENGTNNTTTNETNIGTETNDK